MSFSILNVAVVLLAVVALTAPVAKAATYHVAAEGDDDADGYTPATPLRTVVTAARRASRGDRILLRRGDVFRESVDIETPQVEISAYGPHEDGPPVLAGSVPVTGWRPHGGEVWVAETEADIGYLFVDGQFMTIARYPNEGWLRTKEWEETGGRGEGRRRRRPSGPTVLQCPELAGHPRNADGYWVGATIRWRHHSWWYETRPVIEYEASGELTLGDRSFSRHGPSRNEKKGWGFFLDGKLEELDAPREWYFDAEEGKVYLWPPDGADPNDLLVEGSVRSLGLRVRDSVVRNVAFRHQKDFGLRIDGRSVVEGCHFEGIGRDAMVSEGHAGGAALRAERDTRNASIRHNSFRNNFNLGITWEADPEGPGSSVIERNVLENTGVFRGYGGSGSWHGVAIRIATGTNVHVSHNRIDGSGYAGILFGTAGNFAEYNIITNAMATMNDGGAIYTNCSRSTIRYNIIRDTRGGMESSGTWANISHGIWPEFLRDYRENVIEGNTVVNSGADGLFLPNNFECVVRDNVLYANDRYQLLLTGMTRRHPDGSEQNHLIAHNVLYATCPDENALYFDPRHHYGTLKGNYYCNPHREDLVCEGDQWPGTGREQTHTLAEWQADYPWADPRARTDVHKVEAGEDDPSEIFINDTERPKVIELEGAWRDLDGNEVGDRIRLEPFSSMVLLRAK
jgi:parallel beta-helix repeat protein